MDPEDERVEPARPDRTGSPTSEQDPEHSRSGQTDTATSSLPAANLHTDTAKKSASDSDCRSFQGTGYRMSPISSLFTTLSLQTLHGSSEPDRSQTKTSQTRSQERDIEGDELTAQTDKTCESEDDAAQENQPEFKEMDGAQFGKSENVPDELAKRLRSVRGVSFFAIGVLCKRCPLVIYSSPEFKQEAMEALANIHEEFRRFMVVIWQDICIRGTNDPKFTAKDTLRFTQSSYASALGLPVIVTRNSIDQDALLGTFHCLVGKLLYYLPAVQELVEKESDWTDQRKRKEIDGKIKEELKPFKDSMNNTRGLQEHLKKCKTKATNDKKQSTDHSREYNKAQKDLDFCNVLLQAGELDLSAGGLKIDFTSPGNLVFQAYSRRDDGLKRQIGLKAVGGATLQGEVAVYFFNRKDTTIDVSYPKSDQPKDYVRETEDLDPLTSKVWNQGPVSDHPSDGYIVYTSMEVRKIETDHMRDFTYSGGIAVRHVEETTCFSVLGDSSSVVYLIKEEEEPKLLGAISSAVLPHDKDERIWIYYDAKTKYTDGPVLHGKTEPVNIWAEADDQRPKGVLVPTKGVTMVIPFYNQFKVVKDHLGYDVRLSK